MFKSGPNHGHSYHKLYGIWCTMRNRCYNPKVEKYSYYGGRGITVCDAWQNDFMSFFNWATANDYRSYRQLDREDNNGNYSPENCRWVLPKVQQRNRSNNVYLTAFGETKLRAEWLEDKRCQVSLHALRRRLDRRWSVEDALTQPLIKPGLTLKGI